MTPEIVRRLWYEIAKHKAVPFDDGTLRHRDWAVENRSITDAGMKLTVLTARIHARWEVGKQCVVERPSSEGTVKYARVHADDHGSEPIAAVSRFQIGNRHVSPDTAVRCSR